MSLVMPDLNQNVLSRRDDIITALRRMSLEARVRRAFDPSGVFESGRFLDHNDAN
jgi:hypothetical protein